MTEEKLKNGQPKNSLDHLLNNNAGEIEDKIVMKPGELPVKQFIARNSLFTDLVEIKHFQIIYNLFVVLLLGLFVHSALYDYVYHNRIKLGFYLLGKGFARPHWSILIWVCMFLTQFLIYAGFKCWATIRVQLKPKSTTIKIWDRLWLILFPLYMPFFMYFSTLGIVECEIPYAASVTLLCEVGRLMMKSYAFVRSNAPRVLKYSPNAKDRVIYPSFEKFFYFLWVPTLIYRDSYPRKETINWNYVLLSVAEFMGSVLFMSFAIDKFVIPTFQDYGLKHYSWKDILILTLGQMPVSFIFILSTYYAILHSWMNAFAEILRFSDRLFYKDWWTSTTYEKYHRTWNVMVHDWLYTYVYKDFYEIVVPKNKIVAKYAVFFLSAVFHDYIMGFGLRYYTPVLFVQFFVVGVLLTFIKTKDSILGNILFWYSFIFGMSVNLTFYTIEYFARVHCPIENPSFWNYFKPMVLTCYK